MILQRDQVDQIMAVMAVAFDPAWGEQWSRRQVEDALLIGNCHCLLADGKGNDPTEGADVAGFSLSRAGYEEEELLLFAVVPSLRRHGIGANLLTRFAVAARARGAKRLLLEMRRGNPAESLYSAHGFTPIGTRPMYYRMPSGGRIDAITFACPID